MFELTTLVVIGTGYTGSCKSNYHAITATTALIFWNCISLIVISYYIFGFFYINQAICFFRKMVSMSNVAVAMVRKVQTPCSSNE